MLSEFQDIAEGLEGILWEWYHRPTVLLQRCPHQQKCFSRSYCEPFGRWCHLIFASSRRHAYYYLHDTQKDLGPQRHWLLARSLMLRVWKQGTSSPLPALLFRSVTFLTLPSQCASLAYVAGLRSRVLFVPRLPLTVTSLALSVTVGSANTCRRMEAAFYRWIGQHFKKEYSLWSILFP